MGTPLGTPRAPECTGSACKALELEGKVQPAGTSPGTLAAAGMPRVAVGTAVVAAYPADRTDCTVVELTPLFFSVKEKHKSHWFHTFCPHFLLFYEHVES